MNKKQNVDVDLDKHQIIEKPPKVLNIPFADFWNLYDKKVGKDGIEKKWRSLTNKERLAVMEYLPKYILSTPDKMFRKHPKTFLNGKCWNDEIIKPTPVNKYSELLKHPAWQRKKSEIMQRDNFTCQLCGDMETELHVHHKKYIPGKNPWEYDNDLLITLCINCHKKIS